MLKRIIAAISTGAFVCATAWLGGFGFDTRGAEAAIVFFAAVAASGFAYLFAGLDW